MDNLKKSSEDIIRENEKLRSEIDNLRNEIERLHTGEEKTGIRELRDCLNDTNYEISSLKFALDEAAIIAITDIKGTITYVNKKFCELSKYGPEELIGQNHRIINSGYHPAEFFKDMYRSIANGNVWKGQIKNRAKDGTYYWVDTTIVPLANKEGRLIKYLAIRFDITAQKKQEEQLQKDKERYEAIIAISGAFATATTDIKGVLDFTARTLSGVLGGAIVIRVISEEEQSLKVLAYHHTDKKIMDLISKVITKILLPLDKGLYGDVIRTGKPLLIAKVNKEEFAGQADPEQMEFLQAFDISSAVVAPLKVMSSVIGVVSLTHFTPGESYTQDELIYLQNIAQKIALGISNTELLKQNQLEIERRKKTEEVLREYERRYSALFNNKTIGIAHCRTILDEHGKPVDYEILQTNDAYTDITGIRKEDIEGRTAREVFRGIENFSFDYIGNYNRVALEGGELNFETFFEATGQWLSNYIYSPKHGEFTAIFADISKRKSTEQALVESQTKLLEAQRLAHLGSYYLDIRTGKMQWTEELFRILGMEPESGEPDFDRAMEMVHPDDREKIAEKIQKIIDYKSTEQDEYRIILKGGTVKHIHIIAYPSINESGEVESLLGTVMDITERKLTQQRTDELLREVERSNKELEQFAYIASHDMQEPLRMITNYLKLLSQRYKDKLDEKANIFIDFAVDGAYRMNILIRDLLTFSRITTKANPFEPVDLGHVLGEIILDLKFAIEESSAEILIDSMPTINADKVQMWQLFKNLISNAIKFKNVDPPLIKIKAVKRRNFWQFSVTDNGIGIKQEYYDRIFMIFQRLHEREKYPGTGIGLAVCQKIVERHKGRIWVESEEGKGTTFYFTIPANL